MDKSYKIMSIMLALFLSFSLAAPVAEASFMDDILGFLGLGGDQEREEDLINFTVENFTFDEDSQFSVDFSDHLYYKNPDIISMTNEGSSNILVSYNFSESYDVIFNASANWNGNETITFTVTSSENIIDSDSILIIVNPINDIPVAYNLSVTTQEDTPIPITLNATDEDEDALTYSVESNATNGTISLNGNVATYTPNGDFVGFDSFNYMASDNSNSSNIATVTINVTEVIDVGFDATSDFSDSDLYLGDEVAGNITIVNTGDTTQTFTITQEAKDDGESSGITLTISETQDLENIESGESVEVSYTYSISSTQDIIFEEDMGYTVTISDGISAKDLDFTSKIKSHLFDLDNFEIDPEDDLNPGDSFEIKMDIENLQNFDVDDVEVRVTIINMEEDGDDLEITNEFNLDDDEIRDNEEFNFRVPYNVDETPNADDRYSVEVYITGRPDDDDSYHDERKVKFLFNEKIEVVKEDDDEVSITSFDIAPLDPQCGSQMTIITTAVNTGADDQREMYLKLTVNELNIIETSHPFELDSDNDDDREREEMFTFTIPGNATSGDYVVKIWAYDKNDNLLGYDSKTMSVAGNCGPSTDDDSNNTDDDDTNNDLGSYDLQGADGSWPFSFITGAAISDLFGANGLKTTFWLLGVLALIIINIYFILLLRRTSIKG